MGRSSKLRRLDKRRAKQKAELAKTEGELFALDKLPAMLEAVDGWIDVPLFDSGKERPVPGLYAPDHGKATLTRATEHAGKRARFEFSDPPLAEGLTAEGRRVLKKARRLGTAFLVAAYEAHWTGGPEPKRRLTVCLRVGRRGTEPRRPKALRREDGGGGCGLALVFAALCAAGIAIWWRFGR